MLTLKVVHEATTQYVAQVESVTVHDRTDETMVLDLDAVGGHYTIVAKPGTVYFIGPDGKTLDKL